ncbi:hypothetical protein BU26DRAFT_520983 [Trematosphaeria pertusa]|uniref:Uncharacterized protein n=1 Tax=Trematosphaeria pertusa TaxID=390896 RepID=A0A6A6IAK5_9PLEO|nr:uncharacterized protein BU26DRAFT_520983 [Trematosphaeria pertusa]KAF2246523.1 hypothetical protein BU26DRAFT_520983 [Trematosphaeria pertusa]
MYSYVPWMQPADLDDMHLPETDSIFACRCRPATFIFPSDSAHWMPLYWDHAEISSSTAIRRQQLGTHRKSTRQIANSDALILPVRQPSARFLSPLHIRAYQLIHPPTSVDTCNMDLDSHQPGSRSPASNSFVRAFFPCILQRCSFPRFPPDYP